MPSLPFLEPPAPAPASELDAVDALVARVAARKDHWARLKLAQRIALLSQLQTRVVDVAERWSNASCDAMGIDRLAPLAGEQWIAGPVLTARNIHLLIQALQKRGAPAPVGMRRQGDQHIATVLPASSLDKVVYAGLRAEVWIEKGKSPSQGKIYRRAPQEGKVCLVLGAGNVSSIAPMDVLYKLFVENQVCVLKMNPVNAYIGPFIAEAFEPLISEGYLEMVYGDAAVGKHLTHHPQVDAIHITGSDHTHDAIVWGESGEQQALNKQNDTPALQKPITSELGCVTPVLVVPGPWTEEEIEFQAKHVASMVAQNASFNCNAAKVVVVARGWSLRERFLQAVRYELSLVPERKAYYPGAQQRYAAFMAQYPNAVKLTTGASGVVPWTVIPNVNAVAGEYALTHEAFCGLFAEVTLDADDAESFLLQAVPFANDACWGTLSCTLLIHPKTQAHHPEAFQKAVADLRYGGIGVNAWCAVLFGLGVTSWGAFPGHPLNDIGSGRGVVHNTYMFDHPEKSVLYAPFVMRPTPVWFAQHKNLRAVGQKLVAVEAAPSLLKLPGLLAAAFKG